MSARPFRSSLVSIFRNFDRRKQPRSRHGMSFERLDERITPTVNAMFAPTTGTLTVFGDTHDNRLVVGRDTEGRLMINGGAVPVTGGVPTAANTTRIQIFGDAGNDYLWLDESQGFLPDALLQGDLGDDILIGGSAANILRGGAGNDLLVGSNGVDLLLGGGDQDALIGGGGDDQVLGDDGDDRVVWNPGDGSDVVDGGAGRDMMTVNGEDRDEEFTVTANGTRVRFDRLGPEPFFLDMGGMESLVLNAYGGNDRFSATGNLAALIQMTVDGGAGDDILMGGNGADRLLGGKGDDRIDGNQGVDTILMGKGNDTFQWDPGDGSDIVDGQAGLDRFVFNGSNIGERLELSAEGSRLRFTRDVASITMAMSDMEKVELNVRGGADAVTLNDLTGSGVLEVGVNLGEPLGGTGGDAQADRIVVRGTSQDDSILVLDSLAGVAALTGWGRLEVSQGEPALDSLMIEGLGGNDFLDASGFTLGTMIVTLAGGDDDDVLIGGSGDDVLLGGAGDDLLIGGPGTDILDGGLGSNVLIQ